MRIDLLTREYPPNIYGGAGVHVAELTRALRADGTPACWGSNIFIGSLLPSDNPLSIYTKLEASRDFTCGLREDGSLGCWGRNTYNQAPTTQRARP